MKCECIDVQYSAVQDHFNSAQMHRKVEMGTLQKKSIQVQYKCIYNRKGKESTQRV